MAKKKSDKILRFADGRFKPKPHKIILLPDGTRVALGVKKKAKGKLEPVTPLTPTYKFNPKAKDVRHRYDFGLTKTSAKTNWFVYREFHTGRFVSKSKIKGKRGKKVKIELWRYSKDSPHKFKRLWEEKKYVKRKKPISHDTERLILRAFYRRNRSRFLFDVDLQKWVAFTRSP
jgi:hypothetical protein